jgi:hypothetical protein
LVPSKKMLLNLTFKTYLHRFYSVYVMKAGL